MLITWELYIPAKWKKSRVKCFHEGGKDKVGSGAITEVSGDEF
jgi:hypothetical protein